MVNRILLLTVLEGGGKPKMKVPANWVSGEDLILTDGVYPLGPHVADRLNNLPLSYFIRALIPFIGVEPS
jgi:hypothetical protein